MVFWRERIKKAALFKKPNGSVCVNLTQKQKNHTRFQFFGNLWELSDLGSAACLPALLSDEPCTIVIFGASGDLTVLKLIPALYHLFREGQMPESFRVVGFARHVF